MRLYNIQTTVDIGAVAYTSSQQSSIANTHSRRLGGHAALVSPRYCSEPPANTESLPLGSVDNRDICDGSGEKTRVELTRRVDTLSQDNRSLLLRVSALTFVGAVV
jgi:hypothetical protein